MKQRKQQFFIKLRTAFEYTEKQTLYSKSLVLVVIKIALEKLIAISDKIKWTCFPWRSAYVSAPIEIWTLIDLAHIIDLDRLPDIDTSTTYINNKQHFVNAVISNFCVLGTYCNWSQLLFLGALHIKNLALKTNGGLKATLELVLFR